MGKKSFSADVLDDADRVKTQMDWVLFANEQDQRLFGESDVEWRPGDPLGEVMVKGWFTDDENVRTAQLAYELSQLTQRRDDSEVIGARCPDCLVSWDGPMPCFNCGKQRMDDYFYHFGETSTSAEWRARHWDKADIHEAQEVELVLQILQDGITSSEWLDEVMEYVRADRDMVDRIWRGSNPRVSPGFPDVPITPGIPRYHHPQAGIQEVPMPGTHSDEYHTIVGLVRGRMRDAHPRDTIRILSLANPFRSAGAYAEAEVRPEDPIQTNTTILTVMTFFAFAPFVGDPQTEQGRYIWRAAVDDEGRYVAAEDSRLVIEGTVPAPRVEVARAQISIRTGDGQSGWIDLGTMFDEDTEIELADHIRGYRPNFVVLDEANSLLTRGTDIV